MTFIIPQGTTLKDEYDGTATEEIGKRFIFMGAPGSGKTAALFSMLKEYKILLWDLDYGVDVLFDATKDKEDLANVYRITLADSADNPIAIEALIRAYRSNGPIELCKAHGKTSCGACAKAGAKVYPLDINEMTPKNGWIHVIDSGTALTESLIFYVCDKGGLDPESLAKDDKKHFGVWQVVVNKLTILYSGIRAKGLHHITMAHEMEVGLDDKSKKLAPNLGTRNFARNFGGSFDGVFRFTCKNGTYRVLYADSDKQDAIVKVRRNLDLSKEGVEFVDFFKPYKDIEHKLDKLEIRLNKATKAKIGGSKTLSSLPSLGK